jgi:hypothetical protein
MQKSLSLVVTAALGLGLVGMSSPTSSYASTPQACASIDSYDASEDAPVYNSSTSQFEISRHDQLIYLSENFESKVTGVTGITNEWREQDFVLTQSVNLDGCNFTPIGRYSDVGDASFTGTFDGQGNSILGLVSDGDGDRGLFGMTDGDSSSGDYVEISHLNLAATIEASASFGAGALVASAIDTKISQVSASGTASSTGNNVGGLVGALGNSTISHSTVGVHISTSSDSLSIGGMVGVSSDTSEISNSYALGNVSGKDAGGVVGAVSGLKITLVNTYAAGSVTGSGTPGGLVGELDGGTVTAQNSFWDITRTGRTTSAGDEGTGKTSVEMTTASTFSAWNGGNGLVSWAPFDASTDTIWGMCSSVNEGYPYLLWEQSTNPCGTGDSGDSFSADSATVTERASSAGIHFDTGIEVGDQHSGTLILAEGEGLARGQAFRVTLNPGGTVLASGTASRFGYFSTTTTLPVGLTPGTYTLSLTSKDPAGNPLVLTERFGVNSSGLFTAATPNTASNSESDNNSAELAPASETSGEGTEEPAAEADPGTSDATKTSTPAQDGDDNYSGAASGDADSSTTSSPDGTSAPIPGWLVITASSILIALLLGGVGIGIYRARQPRDW